MHDTPHGARAVFSDYLFDDYLFRHYQISALFSNLTCLGFCLRFELFLFGVGCLSHAVICISECFPLSARGIPEALIAG